MTHDQGVPLLPVASRLHRPGYSEYREWREECQLLVPRQAYEICLECIECGLMPPIYTSRCHPIFPGGVSKIAGLGHAPCLPGPDSGTHNTYPMHSLTLDANKINYTSAFYDILHRNCDPPPCCKPPNPPARKPNKLAPQAPARSTAGPCMRVHSICTKGRPPRIPLCNTQPSSSAYSTTSKKSKD